jgi:tRNA pseudouridine38-40 synthase
MFFFKLNLEYDGTNYLGWQIQVKQGKTIQGEIIKSLQELFKTEDIKVWGASRTDSGVHALSQVAKIQVPFFIEPENLLRGLNSLLNSDIRIKKIEACDEDFRPTNDAKNKTYEYHFTAGNISSGVFHHHLAHYSFDLDIEKMNQAAKLFIGRHDFMNYFCEGTEVASTVREIYFCEIVEINANQNIKIMPRHYALRINGNGFLKQMVRMIVGVLWAVGRGKVSLVEVENSLKIPSDRRLAAVAPPSGLYLVEIQY